MNNVKIEMIHDAVCSWCAIGYANLRNALSEVSGQVNAELRFLPFELNPNMGPKGEPITAHLMRRKGWTETQAMEYRRGLILSGLEAGVHFDFKRRTHYYNSFETHCLMHWAETQGRQLALNDVLVPAYFAEGANLGDRKTLLALAARAGLDPVAASEALASGRLVAPVRRKLQRVARLGVKSVPAFVFNKDVFVSGSNSVDFFRDFLLDLTAALPGRHSAAG